jgi:predicted RNA-binding protein with RPS1 domain
LGNICALATPVSTSSVRLGKLADKVIFSDSVFDLKPEAIRNVKLETTTGATCGVTARENFSMKRRTIERLVIAFLFVAACVVFAERFRATIIDVRNYGLMVELPDALVTGLVHVSSLTDDFYVFDLARWQLMGRRSRKRFSVGDELSVFVVRVDAFKRQVDFAIALASEVTRKRGRSKGSSTLNRAARA